MIFAKKHLGQNFLIDRNVINNIITELKLTEDDIVLEIGPGHGEITNLIVDRVKRIFACEIDKKLAQGLERKFLGHSNIKVINSDFQN